MNALETLDRYIRARYPIIGIQSHEESRVMASIDQVATTRRRVVGQWAMTTGLQNVVGVEADQTADIVAALTSIFNYPNDPPTVFVMKDMHRMLNDPLLIRFLRDIAQKFEENRHTLILLSPKVEVPNELEKTMVVIDWPLPDVTELAAILKRCQDELPTKIPVHLNGSTELVIDALRGLTAFEAGSVLLNAIASTGELSETVIPIIVQEKRNIIRKSGAIEYFESDVRMGQVGGLQYLKDYAAETRSAFTKTARDFGIDTPKGVLIVGVPGTGKSLTAKAIAGGQMPLLRLDIGAVMGSLLGQSEGNMRDALKIAEAVSPAVLWIDEIEKALAGVESSGQTDGGVTTRVFGTLLTWMQETTSPVYVVATANDVRVLKPELIRRFDDLIFVDLPCFEDRKEVFNVHLAKRNQDPTTFDLDPVVTATWGYTGAEIEKVVKAAMKIAFGAKEPLTSAYLLQAVSRVIPIAQTMEGQIADVRSWAKTRALPAAAPLEPRTLAQSTDKRTVEL